MPKRTLSDSYRLPGFKPKRAVQGVFGDSHARIVTLVRQGKKVSAVSVEQPIGRSTITKAGWSGIFPAAPTVFTSNWTSGVSSAGGAAK